jgi:glycosyltransferase involved in cell wall biosynthesis
MQIHSEVIPILEEPLIHPAIKKYLSIRDSVTDYIKTFGIEEENIISVDNPFDLTRFNTNYTVKENQKRIVLFVGTVDYLRIKMLEDLAKITQDSNQILWIVGKDNEDRLVEIKKQSNVTYFGETDKVEDYIKECDITAGIFKGRTTIEGWLCGKPAWIYYVNRNGNILSKSMGVEVPTDLERYSGKNVAQKMLNIYNEIL